MAPGVMRTVHLAPTWVLVICAVGIGAFAYIMAEAAMLELTYMTGRKCFSVRATYLIGLVVVIAVLALIYLNRNPVYPLHTYWLMIGVFLLSYSLMALIFRSMSRARH